MRLKSEREIHVCSQTPSSHSLRSPYAVFLGHLGFDCDPSQEADVEFSVWGIMSVLKKSQILEPFRFWTFWMETLSVLKEAGVCR